MLRQVTAGAVFEMSFISSAGEEPTGDETVTAVVFFLLSLVYGQYILLRKTIEGQQSAQLSFTQWTVRLQTP